MKAALRKNLLAPLFISYVFNKLNQLAKIGIRYIVNIAVAFYYLSPTLD